jgi:phosphoserine/homoserine phosphotransferase
MPKPLILASDMEGVLTPEIWIAVAERTGIERLRLTTRDLPDYDKLMRGRIAILREHGLELEAIQRVISQIAPLPGAAQFVRQIRERAQLIILSDTFYEFAAPLMLQLELPTIFCHTLQIDADGMISGYQLRLPDSKTAAVRALQGIGFHIVAVGDSYNDIGMLAAAERGILFRPPPNVIAEFPHFPVTESYDELLRLVFAE